METIQIKYHSKEIERLDYIEGKSDWIDLRSAEHVCLRKGEHYRINLGVSMRLPDGYEALVISRSSTFDKFGILQTNAVGLIDESYGKNNTSDVWKMPVLAVRDTEIQINDRICQFRIQQHQPKICFEEIESLPGDVSGEARGGFGSTGIK